MPLAWHIEHLLAVHGITCYRGISQVVVPFIPPGLRLSFQIIPPNGVYAWIKDGTILSPQIIPDVWYATIITEGNILFDGTVSQAFTNLSQDILPSLTISTRARPVQVNMINNSNLAQYFEVTFLYIEVLSEADFLKIMKTLRYEGIVI